MPSCNGTDAVSPRIALRDNRRLYVRWPRTTLAPACKHLCKHLETLRALTHRIITRDYHMCSLLHADQGNRHRRYRSNAQGGGGTALTKKLLEKQKKGKARMREYGNVSIPQEAFIAALRMGEE